MNYELHIRQWISAAELLTEAPEGEPVLYFPRVAQASSVRSGDGTGAQAGSLRYTGDDRIVLRIGIADFSWVGSFERGVTDFCTVQVMPDNRNLLVVANGAGYLVEAVSHALVGVLERDIVTVVSDDSSPVLLIDHGGTTLEAYGPEGRMWSTGAIGCGGFRGFDAADGVLTFEAKQADGEWAEMSVDVTASRAAP
jgi:hypothetical protein